MDWRHEAACRDEDPELFFPSATLGPALIQIEEAKRVCRSCNVMDSCLQWAMDTSQEAGVWGGMMKTIVDQLAVEQYVCNRPSGFPLGLSPFWHE